MSTPPVRTLCIDVGGSGLKALVVDARGHRLTDRSRIPTPRPARPAAIVAGVLDLAAGQGDYDRVSVGFPGVVEAGIVRTAPNLGRGWANYPLREAISARLGKPVRVTNDAGVQGLGVIEGRGTEVVITLGTGMGFGLFIDGRYVPNIELGHHPFRKGQTYEDRVCEATRARIGNKRWRKRVRQVLDRLRPTFNYRVLYVGGGNARRLRDDDLPERVVRVDNIAGLLGGIRLWQEAEAPPSDLPSPLPAAPTTEPAP